MNPGFESKAAKVSQFAERLFAETPSWKEFFRQVLGATGVIRQIFGDPEDRYEFERSREYARIEELLASLRATTTTVMALRLPQYLLDALRAEAHDHRMSLNKLCISKLAQHSDVSLVPVPLRGGSEHEETRQIERAAAEYAGSHEYTLEPVKTLAVTEAQNALPTLVSKAEPLVLTDGSRPVAVLIHVNSGPGEFGTGDQQVNVLPLKDVLSDSSLLASIADDAVCVVTSFEKPPAREIRDWWGALQRIGEDQQRRGFVGSVAEIDRGDRSYDERMEEIYKQTMPKTKSG